MMLEKLRHDGGWHDCDRDERIDGKGWAVVCRVARRWFTSAVRRGPGGVQPVRRGYVRRMATLCLP